MKIWHGHEPTVTELRPTYAFGMQTINCIGRNIGGASQWIDAICSKMREQFCAKGFSLITKSFVLVANVFINICYLYDFCHYLHVSTHCRIVCLKTSISIIHLEPTLEITQ